jgi:anti-sigma regulatory factor (Ser/Thr protein kinase)
MKPRDLSLLLEPAAETLPSLRGGLRSWLIDNGATSGECDDIVLACWEAAAVNALEQPVVGTETIAVVAERFEDDVLICVADCRRERRTTVFRPDHELGLKLMVTLMDRVQILDSAEGTRMIMSRCLSPNSATGPSIRP